MVQFDLTSIVSLVIASAFGSSGVVAWILTYIQMKNERKRQAIEYFRQIVLTPDFLHYLGLSFGILSFFSVGSPITEEGLETIHREVTEWSEYKTRIQGTLFFFPYKVLTAFNSMNSSIIKMVNVLLSKNPTTLPDAYNEANSAITNFGLELKKVLGIDISTD
jgi:hypothetical protein